MLSCRKNISITNEDVAIALERAENASKFVEQAILYYLEEHEKEYATVQELETKIADLKADMKKLIYQTLNELIKDNKKTTL